MLNRVVKYCTGDRMATLYSEATETSLNQNHLSYPDYKPILVSKLFVVMPFAL